MGFAVGFAVVGFFVGSFVGFLVGYDVVSGRGVGANEVGESVVMLEFLEWRVLAFEN